MRGVAIALAVTALLHSRRKPLENTRDERGDGDCFPHLLCSDSLEQDGWVTLHATNNATKGQRDHGH